MLVKVKTSAISGIDAISVDVEVSTTQSLEKRSFNIIGLVDSAVRESKERVDSAICLSGYSMPKGVLVNLAPAEIKKEGSSFDLAIAVGILSSTKIINPETICGRVFHGELSLDGKLKPIRGVVALTIEAKRKNCDEIIVPVENKIEASLISGIKVTAVNSLKELVAYLNFNIAPQIIISNDKQKFLDNSLRRISDVCGQESAKRAMLIAAAGGHNLLMIGPPGCGKSMLAERFSSIMPPLTEKEKLETIKIHSIVGSPVNRLLSGERPYRNPHHVISEAGLIGGGSSPKPGEISLAHNGVLFLDEFPEFKRGVLESLRAPLEGGKVCITRAKASLYFPAKFQLLAAMNPCPCGRLGVQGRSCQCSQNLISKYLQKLSQPILDRIDLHVELDAIPFSVISSNNEKDTQKEEEKLQEIVLQARDKQNYRRKKINAYLSLDELKETIQIKDRSLQLLERASDKLGLSARGFVRILRVAQTVADIDGYDIVTSDHIAEAINFRCLERIEKYCSSL